MSFVSLDQAVQQDAANIFRKVKAAAESGSMHDLAQLLASIYTNQLIQTFLAQGCPTSEMVQALSFPCTLDVGPTREALANGRYGMIAARNAG